MLRTSGGVGAGLDPDPGGGVTKADEYPGVPNFQISKYHNYENEFD